MFFSYSYCLWGLLLFRPLIFCSSIRFGT